MLTYEQSKFEISSGSRKGNQMHLDPYPVLCTAKKISAAYVISCRRVIKKHKISHPEFEILIFLATNPERCTAKDIGDARCIKANVLSVHIEKLVKAGYLQRSIIEGDRRKVKLSLTPAASPVIADARATQKEFIASIVNGASLEEIEAFLRFTRLMAENADRILNENKTFS